MASAENWQDIEKKAGISAALSLRIALRREIGSHFRERSGAMLKSNVTARFKNGLLDRLVITSPHYSFQQHYGYDWPDEKVKSHNRRPNDVRSHFRGGSLGTGKTIQGYFRGGSRVSLYKRGIANKAQGHFSKALDSSNVLETLADELAESRVVRIVDTKFSK